MIKPLSETKTLTAEGALNQPVRGPKRTRDITPHSTHSAQRSEHYHAAILGGRSSAARITNQLNPDRPVERTRTQGRRFPGLAN